MYEVYNKPVSTRARRHEEATTRINNDLRDRTVAVNVSERDGRFDVRCFDKRNRFIGGTSCISNKSEAMWFADFYLKLV